MKKKTFSFHSPYVANKNENNLRTENPRVSRRARESLPRRNLCSMASRRYDRPRTIRSSISLLTRLISFSKLFMVAYALITLYIIWPFLIKFRSSYPRSRALMYRASGFYFENLSVLNARRLTALLHWETPVSPTPFPSLHTHPRSRASGYSMDRIDTV